MSLLNNLGDFDAADLIRQKQIETHFQPIVSVRRKMVIGVEALSRGVDVNGQTIAPRVLFDRARHENLTLELDFLCRETALRNFAPLHRVNPDLILFLNAHVNLRDDEVAAMLEMTERYGIDPRNISIEILESDCGDAEQLRKLITVFRRHGFLVAIDDVGVGYSNFDRLIQIKPDILKADLSLVRDIDSEVYKQEIFKSLVFLSEKIGGWIITEGVETQAEAVTALELGGDIIQGYFFGRPRKAETETVNYNESTLLSTAKEFKSKVLSKIKNQYYRREERLAVVNKIASRLIHCPPEQFEAELRRSVKQQELVESACVINDDGIQITDTVLNSDRLLKEKTIIFQPPAKGSDHALKEYYYGLRETRINIFETQPYVPLPSQQMCITVSTFFKDHSSKPFILCLHLKAE